MSKPELIFLTNIDKFYEDPDKFSHLAGSFKNVYMPDDEKKLKNLFNREKFILTVINGDKKFEKSYFDTLVYVLKKTSFPALILANKPAIKKYFSIFPTTVDFIVKPVGHFEFHLRLNRLMELYKSAQILEMLKNLESEIDIRGHVLELSRQELISGSETIKALDTAMELSRQELLSQKDEINAREQVLELSRMDKMDLMTNIKALESIMNFNDKEKSQFKNEIEALENLLIYVIKHKKNDN